jgi:hypothetical protein
MPTQSNTSSDLGQDTNYAQKTVRVRDHKSKQTRLMAPRETPRERMIRVVQSVRKRKR